MLEYIQMTAERGGVGGEESKKYFVKGGIALVIGVFCFLGSIPVGVALAGIIATYEFTRGIVSKKNKK